ncbi:MAG: sporulation protein YunB [Clostridia bacterium]|nr:sporulation protein YunB [Clostridia bacterium]
MHFGSFTGLKLLSGRGPRIKITISSIGNVKTDLKSEFSSKGINQTLHRVYLQVDCEVSILTPFDNITKRITNQVLIAEHVIVGHIPDTYYNLEGMTQDDVMEVMQ